MFSQLKALIVAPTDQTREFFDDQNGIEVLAQINAVTYLILHNQSYRTSVYLMQVKFTEEPDNEIVANYTMLIENADTVTLRKISAAQSVVKRARIIKNNINVAYVNTPDRMNALFKLWGVV